MWVILPDNGYPTMHIYVLSWVSTFPSLLLFSSLCVYMCSYMGVHIQVEWSIYSGTVRAPYLPMWDHRNNFCWWLPHVDYLNSSLTNVCNLSIPTYAKQVSCLEGRGVAKCLTIVLCEMLLYRKENVSLKNLRSPIVKLFIC